MVVLDKLSSEFSGKDYTSPGKNVAGKIFFAYIWNAH